jgi:hypothetical protein
VSRIVLLDAGPLGLVTNPKQSPPGTACARWLQSMLASRARVIVPEINDYEVRRELLRANKTAGVAQLDALAAALDTFRSPRPRCARPPYSGLGPGGRGSRPREIKRSTAT